MTQFKDTNILDLVGMERRAERDGRFCSGFAWGAGLTALVTMAGAPVEQNIVIPATCAAVAVAALIAAWFARTASRVLMREITERLDIERGADREVHRG